MMDQLTVEGEQLEGRWLDEFGYNGYFLSTAGRLVVVGRNGKGAIICPIEVMPSQIGGGYTRDANGFKVPGKKYLVLKILKTQYTILGVKRIEEFHSLSRLMGLAFLPDGEKNFADKKMDVDHINHCTSNNNIDNLRWVSHKENCNDPIRCAAISAGLKKRWKDRSWAKSNAAAQRRRWELAEDWGFVGPDHEFAKKMTFKDYGILEVFALTGKAY